ncbi:histidine kinase [Mucilaginibacter daejeonensis]|uniref:sensor histidine kinase n=1 Tax=Mucilaginibacter daejeonensis TaxID=398049 RepID=UPI001D17287E|nr:histidine kinase [Mucilaginibacter daejeonensis]UEG54253.1 histidine kinase [Mucilaginibacter daejeonensis]
MKKSWQVFWHSLFWITMISLIMYITRTNTKISTLYLVVTFIGYGMINIGLFYTNYLVLIPNFLDKKTYRKYFLLLVLIIVGVGFIKYGVAYGFRDLLLIDRKGKPVAFINYFTSACFTSVIFVLLSMLLHFTVDWFMNERIQRDLENQRLTAELALLRSQINPHFLFNSLNSIYSLAYQRADNTPEAILKLSEIMRYMLYESNDNKVDLEKEITYLQNYIELQKIRFGNSYINFSVEGEVTHQQIVPLLLISFIENAFKHGVANDEHSPIELKIKVDDGHLQFYMHNKKHLLNRDAAGGIGLNNVKRRLKLLYPGQYHLNINDTADHYTCELSLIL